MEFDSKIIIQIVLSAVISLIIGTVFAFVNIGEYSFIFAMLIAGIVAGFNIKNIDSALVVGGVAGLAVSILQGIIAPVVLAPKVAVFFPVLGAFLGLIVAGAVGAGVAALVMEIKS